MTFIQVPFYRPDLRQPELDEVISTLRSGNLTTGPKVRLFEEKFARAVGATHAVAVSSCTAAMSLAVEAMGLKQGQAVLVPTMTFASTAEVVRHHGGIPVFVDCDPVTMNMDLKDAERKLGLPLVGIIPVHVGGFMMDVAAVQDFANRNGLWVVEDAAHAFPASWRKSLGSAWQRCGQSTASVTCFSFSGNSTVYTGEGGMAVTNDELLARRLRMMSLHGLTQYGSECYSENDNWEYEVVASGYKCNLTDIAASIGLHQLERSEALRKKREAIAARYFIDLSDVAEIELPPVHENRIQAWHLFQIRLRRERLSIGHDSFIKRLRRSGIRASVHWRPLHLHPYYREKFGWQPQDFPIATAVWKRLVSLPIFPDMREYEVEHVIDTVRALCVNSARRKILERTDLNANESSAYAQYAL
jgi:perosamine synthetase